MTEFPSRKDIKHQIKKTDELIDRLNGLWEHCPEDFVESRTDWEEVKELADSFYYRLNELNEVLKEFMKNDFVAPISEEEIKKIAGNVVIGFKKSKIVRGGLEDIKLSDYVVSKIAKAIVDRNEEVSR